MAALCLSTAVAYKKHNNGKQTDHCDDEQGGRLIIATETQKRGPLGQHTQRADLLTAALSMCYDLAAMAVPD